MESVDLKKNELQASGKNTRLYLEMVGGIIFAATHTRPDTAFAPSVVSRFAQNLSHYRVLLRLHPNTLRLHPRNST